MSLPPRIALVGFMGSGKSTVGPQLAGRLGYRFLDADDEIAARAGASVAQIFAKHGEPYFRGIEERAILDLLNVDKLVLATGGGAFAQDRCAAALLDRAFTIHLACELGEVRKRVGNEPSRPLVALGETVLASLYAERKDKYSRAHVTVDTTRLSPEDVVDRILGLLKPSS